MTTQSRNNGQRQQRFDGKLLFNIVILLAFISFIGWLVLQLKRPVQLRIKGGSFSGEIVFRDSQLKQKLKEDRIELIYEDDQSGHRERIRDLREGKADLLVMSLDQFLREKIDGKIVGLMDCSVRSHGLVLNNKDYPSLQSLADLRPLIDEEKKRGTGQKLKIIYPDDSFSELLAFLLYHNSQEFDESDFNTSSNVKDASDAWTILQNEQKVAIAVLSEPYINIARQNGYEVLFDPHKERMTIVHVIVASNSLPKDKFKTVGKFMEEYYVHINQDLKSSQIQNQIVKYGNLSKEEAKKVRKKIYFFDLFEANIWLKKGRKNKIITDTISWLAKLKDIDKIDTGKKNAFDNQHIKSAVELINQMCQDWGNSKDICEKPNNVSCPLKHPLDLSGLPKQRVTFKESLAELTDEGKQKLNQLAEHIKQDDPPSVIIKVTGHAYGFPREDENNQLSVKRAEAVVSYLQDIGVRHKKIEPYGKGSSEKLSEIELNDPRQQRVEISFEKNP